MVNNEKTNIWENKLSSLIFYKAASFFFKAALFSSDATLFSFEAKTFTSVETSPSAVVSHLSSVGAPVANSWLMFSARSSKKFGR
jgi:hypothetical protein